MPVPVLSTGDRVVSKILMGEVENEPLIRKYRVWSDSGEWQGEGLQSRKGDAQGHGILECLDRVERKASARSLL